MDEKDFTIELDRHEAYVLLRVMQTALPKLEEDDGWLIFQLIGVLQKKLDE